MTLQQILYFTEIARTKQFTQAAQNLYVSQSALSYAIQALERELGVPLFTRQKSSKQVYLTSYGQSFLPYCEKALGILQDGQHELDILKNPTSGVVSVAYSYLNCHQLIPELFNDFYREHNNDDISVQLTVNHERSQFENDVLSGDADLGFACTQSFDGLETVPVAKQELFLYLSVEHPLANEKRLSLEDIKDEQFLGLYPNSNLHQWINQMFKHSGLRTNLIAEYQDWSSQMVYVSMNRGITISPQLPVDPNLIAIIPLDHPLNVRNIYMFWAKDGNLSPAAEYIRQYCLNWFVKRYGEITDDE